MIIFYPPQTPRNGHDRVSFLQPLGRRCCRGVSLDVRMQIAHLTAGAVAIGAGAWLVGHGYPFLGVLWLGVAVGVILRKTNGGGGRDS